MKKKIIIAYLCSPYIPKKNFNNFIHYYKKIMSDNHIRKYAKMSKKEKRKKIHSLGFLIEN